MFKYGKFQGLLQELNDSEKTFIRGFFNVKERLKYLAVSLGIVALGAGCMVYGISVANKAEDKFMEIPVITSQAELETALEGEAQLYCLTNMEVTGEAAEDPMGILEGDYGYIMYVKETCELQKDSTYEWSSDSNGVSYAAAPSLSLFDTYELELPEGATEFNFYIVDYSEMNADNVKEEYQENIIDGSYYPEGEGDRDGNKRYNVFLAPLGSECALYATVGDGEIVLALNEDAANYIVPGGDIETLFDCHGSSKGMMPTLVGMMIILPLGVMLLFASLMNLLFAKFGGRKKKKNNY